MSITRRSAVLAVIVVFAGFFHAGAATFVYTNNNIFLNNSASGWELQPNGALSPVPGSPFPTGGSGGGTLYASNRVTTSRVRSFLYVTNGSSRTVSAFAVDPVTGVLTAVGTPASVIGSTSAGMSIAPTPNGLHLIAAGDSALTVFLINPDGTLTQVSSIATAGMSAGIRVSPDGRLLAVAFFNRDAVGMYSISGGTLTPVPGSPFAGLGPGVVTGVDINQDSTLLFAGEAGPGTTVNVYQIAANGVLTPIAGSPFRFTSGNMSQVVVLSRDDKFLFATNQGTATVTVLNVAPNGSLSLLPGSPFPAGASEPAGAAVTRKGTPFLLTAHFPSFLAVHTINANGSLTFGATYVTPCCRASSLAIFEQSNADPVVTPAAASTVEEGSPSSLSLGSFTDDSTGPWSVSVNWGDGSATETFTQASTGSLGSRSHTYADDGSFVVDVTVTDNENASGSASSSVTVLNVAPAVTAAANQSATENVATAIALGSFTDPGADTWTATIHWGDGSTSTNNFAVDGSLGSLDHTYADNNAYEVVVTVADEDGGSGSASFTVTVANAAPSVTAAANQSADEATTASFALGSFSDTPADSPWGVVVIWGDGTATDSFTAAGAGSLGSRDHPYADNGNYNVTVTVTDKDGGAGSGSFTVDVRNVAPSVSAGPNQAGSEGSSTTFTLGSFSDPGSDSPWTVTINWGDGSAANSFQRTSAGSLGTLSHSYADNGDYTVEIMVTDKDHASGTSAFTATVANVAPQILASSLSANSVVEGGSVTLTASFADPGVLDAHSVSIAWGDGNTETILLAAGVSQFSASHQYLDDDPTGTPQDLLPVTFTVTDKDGGATSANHSVTVKNQAPVVAMTQPAVGAVYAVGATVDLRASVTDVGVRDTHTCIVNWDNAAADKASDSMTGSMSGSGGAGTCTASYTFRTAGVFSMRVTVVDDDGGSSTAGVLIVVYDAAAGFVTGGGWVDSPAGALIARRDLTGKANFGFVSKYENGKTVPTGNTNFQFNSAGFKFDSTSFEWLVISGRKAQCRGVGTVGGAGNYGFLLTASDGDLPGGDGKDRLRIRIWDRSRGNQVVYDNRLNQSDDMDAADPQILGGGSIVFHLK